MRIFAWSDLHADHAENRRVLDRLSEQDLVDDVLLHAGDISHRLAVFSAALEHLLRRFAVVFFVPGNHDLWVPRDGEDSAAKLRQILALSESLGVTTTAARVAADDGGEIWVVPVLSWYALPEEGAASLYLPSTGPDVGLAGWADRSYVRWPSGRSMAEDLLDKNRPAWSEIPAGASVISFSHFLPRRELLFPDGYRPGETRLQPPSHRRRASRPVFNFSRVAGSSKIDEWVRRAGSTLHVHGHQHRNRNREIDGVRYIAHSLGYPRERLAGHLPADSLGPKEIWGDRAVLIEGSREP